jgi:hypothetical protein
VSDFSDASLRDALHKVIALKESVQPFLDIRGNSLEFSLEEGVARYQKVYQELLKLS